MPSFYILSHHRRTISTLTFRLNISESLSHSVLKLSVGKQNSTCHCSEPSVTVKKRPLVQGCSQSMPKFKWQPRFCKLATIVLISLSLSCTNIDTMELQQQNESISTHKVKGFLRQSTNLHCISSQATPSITSHRMFTIACSVIPLITHLIHLSHSYQRHHVISLVSSLF